MLLEGDLKRFVVAAHKIRSDCPGEIRRLIGGECPDTEHVLASGDLNRFRFHSSDSVEYDQLPLNCSVQRPGQSDFPIDVDEKRRVLELMLDSQMRLQTELRIRYEP